MADFSSDNPGAGTVARSADEFWDSEKAWQASMAAGFQVAVTEPATTKVLLGKSYVTYLVTTQWGDDTHEVRRRFSDFDWLRGS